MNHLGWYSFIRTTKTNITKNATMIKLKMILPLVILSLGLGTAYGSTPTGQEALSWLINSKESPASPATAIKFVQASKITLLDGEEAYLSGVEFEDAPRNSWAGYILIRPKIRQSKILPYGGQSNSYRIHNTYYKDNPINVIEINSASSGQGNIDGVKYMVVFKGFQAQELAMGDVSSTTGEYIDELNDTDCKTGDNIQTFFNVMPYDPIIIKTHLTSNACENLAPKDFKTKTDLIPIIIR
ncbi:hypothetical protein HLH17_16460 [Acinetobacter sp. ANC 5380]|uniref:Uncharacterized protein n=1 Tax=Acinetobacter terrae TaxID=2731247 RepID=A0A7Y2RIR9_9GAMM|nr:hypothetical protein [Acinetobacter terrae]NNH79211.1 hypothetical protein [Acinetobacter terrae]